MNFERTKRLGRFAAFCTMFGWCGTVSAHFQGDTSILQIPFSVGADTLRMHTIGPGWALLSVPSVSGKINDVAVEIADSNGLVVFAESIDPDSSGFFTPKLTLDDYEIRIRAKGKRGSAGLLEIDHPYAPIVDSNPTVWILSPNDGHNSNATEDTGVVVNWAEGAAWDPQDLDISSELSWYVNNAFQGVGPTATLTLPVGENTIRAEVVDGDGLSGSASIGFNVAFITLDLTTDAPTYAPGDHATITLTVESSGQSLQLSGTTDDYAQLILDPPNGRDRFSGLLPTDANGMVTLTTSSPLRNTGTYTILGRVFHQGFWADTSITIEVVR